MDELTKLTSDIKEKRGLTLILMANKAREGITELIATQILHGPLFVVAASEWLPAFELTRALRKRTLEVRQSVNHLHAVRTSTCYRLLDSLANIPSKGEPVLVLDFLHTFYDPDIPLRVRFYELRECCRHLERLALYRRVFVMTQQMPVEDYEKFFPILHAIADKTLYLEPEREKIHQPTLF